MSEADLDKRMKQILISALELEYSEDLDAIPPLKPSKNFQHQMKAMLSDPFAWYRKKTKPAWKKITHIAASVLLWISIGLGSLLMISPDVRGAVTQWVVEWYHTHIVYRYTGGITEIEMPQYGIGNLPKGYQETKRIEASGYMSVTYQNAEGKNLHLDYSLLQQGSASAFVTKDSHIREISVNGYPGQLILSREQGQSNGITWIDTKKNMQFTMDGFFDESDLLHMAERITLIDAP